MTPADILEDAAEIVRAGWIQGDFKDADGTRFCALGALDRVCLPSLLLDRERARNGAWSALTVQIGTTGVAGWNDTEGRTQDEVIEAMLQAAKTLRNQEVSV